MNGPVVDKSIGLRGINYEHSGRPINRRTTVVVNVVVPIEIIAQLDLSSPRGRQRVVSRQLTFDLISVRALISYCYLTRGILINRSVATMLRFCAFGPAKLQGKLVTLLGKAVAIGDRPF